MNQPIDNPPAYEYVVGGAYLLIHLSCCRQWSQSVGSGRPNISDKGNTQPLVSEPLVYGGTIPGPSTAVYHYQDPRTGHAVSSLLPPDAPPMICLQEGAHVPQTRYGILGEHTLHSFSVFFRYIARLFG